MCKFNNFELNQRVMVPYGNKQCKGLILEVLIRRRIDKPVEVRYIVHVETALGLKKMNCPESLIKKGDTECL